MEAAERELAESLLLNPTTRAAVDQLFARDAFQGGFIVSGPRGIGKAALAYRLAASILSGSANLDASDEKVRRLIMADAHPDLHVLERTENERTGKLRAEIDVEAARRVIGKLHQTSVSGATVVIIDLADELGRSAANSLLKILEEPPRGAVLFLLSQSPSRLLPTLRSRCRRISMRAPNVEDTAKWLGQAGVCDPTETQAIAEEAGGLPGLAVHLAQGEGEEARKLADQFFAAVESGSDVLAAARPFGGKNAERLSGDAREIILARLQGRLRHGDHSNAGLARALSDYDRVRDLLAHLGTADPVQSVYLAATALREGRG